MKSIAGLSLLLCLTVSSGCSSLGTVDITVHVDCPVLGKELRLAQDGKDWLLAHEAGMPPSILEFTNAVGRHNEKVAEICQGKKP